MKNSTRIALAIAASCTLALGVASPAFAGPTPTPGTPTPSASTRSFPPLSYFRDPKVALPNCKKISTALALRHSASRFGNAGDLSNPVTHTGYGTELVAVQHIIEDGGFSCTYLIAGSKNTLTISVSAMSPYDRSVVESRYLATYGTTPHSIGGTNAYVGGTGTYWHEVSFLLEEGVLVSGKVHSDGDFFPAVLQNVSDMVYALNH